VTLCARRGSERRTKGSCLGWDTTWWSTGKVSTPFIGLGMVNRAVRKEGERRPVAELLNDFIHGESK
jgi:hypothetical protein